MTETRSFSIVHQFNQFDIPPSVQQTRGTDIALARAFCEGLEGSMYLSGNQPSAIAAAALYVAPIVRTSHRWTQDEIYTWTGISQSTVRKHYQDLPAAYVDAVDADEDIPDAYREDLRKWLRFETRRGTLDSLPDGVQACPNCPVVTPLFGPTDAADHFADEHPTEAAYADERPTWGDADEETDEVDR